MGFTFVGGNDVPFYIKDIAKDGVADKPDGRLQHKGILSMITERGPVDNSQWGLYTFFNSCHFIFNVPLLLFLFFIITPILLVTLCPNLGPRSRTSRLLHEKCGRSIRMLMIMAKPLIIYIVSRFSFYIEPEKEKGTRECSQGFATQRNGTYYSTERNGTERLFRKIPILRNGLKPALDNYPAYNIHFSAE